MQFKLLSAIMLSALLNSAAAFAGHNSLSSQTSRDCFCSGKKVSPLKVVKGMHCGSCSSSSVAPLSLGSFDSGVNSLSIDWFSSAVSQQLKRGQIAFSAGWLSAFSGGAAGGSGNQNYASVIGWGVNQRLQVTFYGSRADDPLFSNGLANDWHSYGVGLRWQF